MVDNMLQHPWIELQNTIKERWLTQKAFSTILWKKISEVNELLKWKRNITIQWDFLLHQALWTPIKYWIIKQIDYEYSLILPASWINSEETKEPTIQKDNQELESDISNNINEIWETDINKSDLKYNQLNTENLVDKDEQIKDIQEADNDRQERVKIFRSF